MFRWYNLPAWAVLGLVGFLVTNQFTHVAPGLVIPAPTLVVTVQTPTPTPQPTVTINVQYARPPAGHYTGIIIDGQQTTTGDLLCATDEPRLNCRTLNNTDYALPSPGANVAH